MNYDNIKNRKIMLGVTLSFTLICAGLVAILMEYTDYATNTTTTTLLAAATATATTTTTTTATAMALLPLPLLATTMTTLLPLTTTTTTISPPPPPPPSSLPLLQPTTEIDPTTTTTTTTTKPKIENQCGVPNTVYIHWDKVRLYLNKYFRQSIPGIIDGSLFKVKKCLFFQGVCDPNKYYCTKESETINYQIIKLEKNNKIIGYYLLKYIEAKTCQCQNINFEDLNYELPWQVPPIIEIHKHFLGFNETR